MILEPTLDDLGVKCGTDKSSRFHGYLDFYDTLFHRHRHVPTKLLEIGVDGGESIKMWSLYFDHPETEIFGCDVHDKGGDLGRGKFIHGDATEPNMVFDIGTQHGPFNIVIEDASHYVKDQKKHLEMFWEYLSPGGIWITEDTHTSYHYPWLDEGDESFVSWLINWIHKLNENGAGHRGVPTQTDIEEIVFRKSIVVIKKR